MNRDELNKRLNEALGLSVKYQNQFIGKQSFDSKSETVKYYKKHFQTNSTLSLSNFNDFIREVPVDFFLPENFVKLLKLILKAEGWCSGAVIFWDDNTVDVFDTISNSKNKSIEENFIEAILASIQEHIDNFDEWEEVRESEMLLKTLKQQAQRVDWRR